MTESQSTIKIIWEIPNTCYACVLGNLYSNNKEVSLADKVGMWK